MCIYYHIETNINIVKIPLPWKDMLYKDELILTLSRIYAIKSICLWIRHDIYNAGEKTYNTCFSNGKLPWEGNRWRRFEHFINQVLRVMRYVWILFTNITPNIIGLHYWTLKLASLCITKPNEKGSNWSMHPFKLDKPFIYNSS